ncbi:hypothetical protein WDH52_22665 [Streptomyces sp. TRM70308]|uniref:hypothetical protein n=1 Tax=Streptomyces sp. TRM70308 TaxID=3131932 RepID=UPI003D062401
MSSPETNPEKGPTPGTAPSRRKRWLTPATVTAALALLAGAGEATHTAVTLAGADRTSPTTVVGTAEAAGLDDGRSRGAGEGLRRLLLPVPEDFRPGPDFGHLPNDVELDGERATEHEVAYGGAEDPELRRVYKGFLEDLRLQGSAMRSYSSDDGRLTVQAGLVKLGEEEAAPVLADLVATELESTSGMRGGPAVDGYEEARCLIVDDPDLDLDIVRCLAGLDGFLVTLNAVGSRPMDHQLVTDMLARQLDRVASPGEYV